MQLNVLFSLTLPLHSVSFPFSHSQLEHTKPAAEEEPNGSLATPSPPATSEPQILATSPSHSSKSPPPKPVRREGEELEARENGDAAGASVGFAWVFLMCALGCLCAGGCGMHVGGCVVHNWGWLM